MFEPFYNQPNGCTTNLQILKSNPNEDFGCESCVCLSSNIFGRCEVDVSRDHKVFYVDDSSNDRVFYKVQVCNKAPETGCKTFTCTICVQSNNLPAPRRSPIQRARKLKRIKVTGGEETRSNRRNIRALTWATQRPTVLLTPGPDPAPGGCKCPATSWNPKGRKVQC